MRMKALIPPAAHRGATNGAPRCPPTGGLHLGACAAALFVAGLCPTAANGSQQDSLVFARHDSVVIRLVDADLRAAVQAIGRHLDRPIAFGAIGDARVTLETPHPVPRAQLVALLKGILESHDHRLVEDSGFYRVEPADRRPLGVRGGGPVPQQVIELFVIRLRHARAVDVAATINALYGRASAFGEPGARPPTLADELRQNLLPPVDAQAGNPPAAPGAATARPAELTGEVTIIPDAATNSLLVRATRSDFELIQAAVNELDIRPLQVLIEVLIAEARRDRSFSFGLGFRLDTTRISDRLGVRGDAAASNAGLGLGDFVLEIMNINDLDLDATLRAAAARGDVSIVSRPVLVAANNETAEIMVGSQRPFVQVSRSLPTDVPNRDQVIQYKDVGTRLVIHPTISADGYVMLDVTQEVNAATNETTFDAPVISTRSVRTRLLVKDGQTVVLGGLTDQQRDRTRSGIPLLSSLPLIGGFFGASSRRSTGTELLLFLTPRLIRTDQDIESATDPLLRRAERIRP